MKKHIVSISAIAIAILLTCGVADDGFADSASKKKDRKGHMSFSAPQVKNTKSVSGIYSGSLQGKIRVGDQTILITRKTRIYKIGNGLVDYGTLVTNSPVHVSVIVKDRTAYAKSVIVSDPARKDDEGEAGTMDSEEPR